MSKKYAGILLAAVVLLGALWFVMREQPAPAGQGHRQGA